MTSPDRLKNQVADHRAATAGARPFPDARDCIRFAITEAGETFDAYLRDDPTYLRNNDKRADIEKETADLGYMICSAIVALESNRPPGEPDERDTRLASLIDRLCYSLIAMNRGHDGMTLSNLDHALTEWIGLCNACGWAPGALLDGVQARIDAKWAKVEQAEKTTA